METDDNGWICDETPDRLTQKEFIKKVLYERGEISRNFCLKLYITRLTSRINDLKNEGWEFQPERRNGDYVYIVKHNPEVYTRNEELEMEKAMEEYETTPQLELAIMKGK